MCYKPGQLICSLHLIDTPLPLWPTFGIKLENEQASRDIPDNENCNNSR